MSEIILTADISDEGIRLDKFISDNSELSRSLVQNIIETGSVTVNGKAVAKSCKLKNGDRICFSEPEPKPLEIEPQNIPLDIRYEDSDVIVINKPKGLVVHPAPGHPDGTVVNALLHHCGDSLSGIGGEKRPGIVHRIDMDTTGSLIICKNDTAHQALAEQLKEEEYPAFLVAEDGWFKVRVGAYLNLDHAAWMEKTLRAAGYPTFMVKEREK